MDRYNNDVRISSNSWGSRDEFFYDSFCSQTDEFVWDHDDMLILFAAGNEGEGGLSHSTCINIDLDRWHRPPFPRTWLLSERRIPSEIMTERTTSRISLRAEGQHDILSSPILWLQASNSQPSLWVKRIADWTAITMAVWWRCLELRWPLPL